MTTEQASSNGVYNPHRFQRPIHESRAKNKIVEAARRGGKSRSALFELVDIWQLATQTPASSALQPPFHAWIVAPSFPQSSQVWTELNAFIPQDWVADTRVHDKQIVLKGDAEGNRLWGLIEVKSAHDPENLQTAGLDFLWVTEAQDISEAAYLKLRPVLRSPERMGMAIWEGIPALYKDHWFWRLAEFAEGNDNENYDYFHWTAYDNPLLSEEQIGEIEQDRELMTIASWERMYLAKRSESAGFFKNISACTAGDMLEGPIHGARYVAGIDLGRKHDPSVMWVMDASKRQAVYQETWDAGEDWAMQREGMIAIAETFECQAIKLDATGMGGDMFFQALTEAGLPVEEYIFTERTRMDLLNNLAISIERSNILFPGERQLLRELRAYQFVKHGRGVRPDHPDGEHDDNIMALGMALLCCDEAAPQSYLLAGNGRMTYINHTNSPKEGLGSKLMRQRLQQRMEQRWQRSGIEV